MGTILISEKFLNKRGLLALHQRERPDLIKFCAVCAKMFKFKIKERDQHFRNKHPSVAPAYLKYEHPILLEEQYYSNWLIFLADPTIILDEDPNKKVESGRPSNQ